MKKLETEALIILSVLFIFASFTNFYHLKSGRPCWQIQIKADV